MEKIALPPPPSKRLIKTSLHQAVLDERLQQVRLLVDKHRAKVDTKDVHGRTPLMLSCMIDNSVLGYRMADVLIKAGADANLKDGMGRTAMSYACMNAREHIVKLILKEDALNLTEPDSDGNTSLHHAAACGNPLIVRALAKAFHRFGLHPDPRNKLGYTAFLVACKSGHFASAYYLITIAKASPSLRDVEFHLSAEEWIQKAARQKRGSDRGQIASAPAVIQRPLASLAFERDNTMYQKPWVPICRLYRTPNTYRAVDSTVQLPEIANHDVSSATRSELVISSMEARQLLLEEIQKVQTKAGVSIVKSPPPRWAYPPTAKLRSLAARATTATSLPDMIYIFQVYSEMYQPPWRQNHTHSRMNELQDVSMSCAVP
nr:ankyrin repeat domain-containing protein 63-like [Biomphalaria glabrata]